MQSEFEKKIQLTMEEFALAPNDAVWQKVEVRIEKDKKRRRIIFYWMAAMILVVAGGGLWLISQKLKNEMATNISAAKDVTRDAINASENVNKTKETIERENKTANGKTVPSKAIGGVDGTGKDGKELGKKESDNAVDAQRKPAAERVEGSSTGATIKRNRAVVSAKETQVKRVGEKRTMRQSTASSKEMLEKKEALHRSLNLKDVVGKAIDDKGAAVNDGNDIAAKAEVVSSAKSTDTVAVLPAPTNSIVKVEPSADKPDSNVASIASVERKKTPLTKSKKLRWGLTVYSGISDNRSGFPLLSEKSLNDALYANPSNGTGSNPGSNANVPVKFGYSASFSYGLGAFLQKPVSKRLSLTAGVNYHYLSATTLTGAKVNGQRSLYDSVLNTRNNLDAFYTLSSFSNGQSQQLTHFTNKYHLLQLPVNVQWQLNGINKKPLLLTAGITPGSVIGTKALYYNRLAQIAYVDKNQFKNFQLATQAGLMFTLSDKTKYNINLGPHIMYGLTNIAKSATQTSQHLFFLGLKSNITFNKK
jgi:hypothetical protein